MRQFRSFGNYPRIIGEFRELTVPLLFSFTGGRWYRVLQHHSGAAASEAGDEPGQGLPREMQVPDTRQSRNERSDPGVHAAVSTVAGNKTYDDHRSLLSKVKSICHAD